VLACSMFMRFLLLVISDQSPVISWLGLLIIED
jgi:hypothetical protein